jgi:hypothetical protein
MKTYKYGVALITKRSGLDRIGRRVSGYRVYISGAGEGVVLRTLKDAKAYVDSKATA